MDLRVARNGTCSCYLEDTAYCNFSTAREPRSPSWLIKLPELVAEVIEADGWLDSTGICRRYRMKRSKEDEADPGRKWEEGSEQRTGEDRFDNGNCVVEQPGDASQ